MDPKFGGSVSGNNFNLHAAQSFGSDKLNSSMGVFAAGSTSGGPLTTGAFAGANAHGLGLSLQHATTHGVGSTLSENASLNLLKSGSHSVDANAFHSRTTLDNGPKYDTVGGNLGWNHAQGHSASLGMSHVPKFGVTTLDAAAKANLWTSQSGASSFDVTGSAQRHLSGPFSGKSNYGAGAGFTHRF